MVILKPKDSVKPFLLLYIRLRSNGLVFNNFDPIAVFTVRPAKTFSELVNSAV